MYESSKQIVHSITIGSRFFSDIATNIAMLSSGLYLLSAMLEMLRFCYISAEILSIKFVANIFKIFMILS